MIERVSEHIEDLAEIQSTEPKLNQSLKVQLLKTHLTETGEHSEAHLVLENDEWKENETPNTSVLSDDTRAQS